MNLIIQLFDVPIRLAVPARESGSETQPKEKCLKGCVPIVHALPGPEAACATASLKTF